MKKLFTLMTLMMAVSFTMAQSVQRDMVILEKATGTWCSWCPSAAQGCHDLLENGAPIAVISNHGGDSYQNTYSAARNSMYAITGYPTAVFDGKQKSVGGSTSGTTAGMYAPIVQNHMVEMCPVKLDMDWEPADDNFTVTVTITKLDEITASDLRLMFFVTESHIPQYWMGQTELNHVNRLMVPDQNGTAFDFSSGDVVEIELDVVMDPSWAVENCEFIVCVQNADAGQPGGSWVKSILNGIKRGVIDLTADFEADVTSIEVGDPVAFTSEHSGGYIGPVPVTYHWEFPGATPDTSNEESPTGIIYNESGYHDVIFVVNKGGQELEILKEDYIYVAPGVGIEDPMPVVAVNCYPNPAKETFTLQVFPGNEASFDLQIVDTRNVVVLEKSHIRTSGEWKQTFAPNLSSGVYFVIVKTETQKQIRKLVIL